MLIEETSQPDRLNLHAKNSPVLERNNAFRVVKNK